MLRGAIFHRLSPVIGKSWTPLKLTSLYAWFRADAGLYQDAAKTTPATAQDAPIGAWADQSGNGRDLAQTTDGNRPTLDVNTGIGGKPAIKAVTTQHFKTAAAWSLSQPFTALCVFTCVDNAQGKFFYVGTGAGASSWAQIAFDEGLRASSNAILNTGAGTVSVAAHQVRIKHNSTTSGIYVDGAGVVVEGNLSTFSLGSIVHIANYLDPFVQPLAGFLAEMVFVAGALSAGEITNWNNYCFTRYGLAYT